MFMASLPIYGPIYGQRGEWQWGQRLFALVGGNDSIGSLPSSDIQRGGGVVGHNNVGWVAQLFHSNSNTLQQRSLGSCTGDARDFSDHCVGRHGRNAR